MDTREHPGNNRAEDNPNQTGEDKRGRVADLAEDMTEHSGQGMKWTADKSESPVKELGWVLGHHYPTKIEHTGLWNLVLNL